MLINTTPHPDSSQSYAIAYLLEALTACIEFSEEALDACRMAVRFDADESGLAELAIWSHVANDGRAFTFDNAGGAA